MPRITAAAAARIQTELDKLRTTGRDEVAAALQLAREAGKMEENTDYWIAAEERDRLEARIDELADLLAGSEVTDEALVDVTNVVDGSVVTVRFEDCDDTERYYVGSRLGAPAGTDVITLDSPVGKALLGTSAGDVATFRAPSGAQLRVDVVAIGAA